MNRYQTNGVCAAYIDVETDGKTVKHVQIYGGCHGQGQALAALVKGRPIDDVVKRLKGIRCGVRRTSCADQLARALELEKKSRQKRNTD